MKSSAAGEPKRSSSIASQKLAERMTSEVRPRIEELEKAAIEEKPDGQEPLSQDSRRGLVRFLEELASLELNAIPSLCLTYEGNIVAEWEASLDEMLSLEFTDPVFLKFVFFYRRPGLADKVLRISGSGAVSGFLDDHPRAAEFLRSLAEASETRSCG